ncbi:MAG: metallophosphoesterase family protein [Candidatus Hodarchaeales archaeon]
MENRELKLAIISDIHGNLEALKTVLADIDTHNVDEVFCAGDIVGYYPHPIECIDLVTKRCTKIIKGNHDEVVSSADFKNRIGWFNSVAAGALIWTRNSLSSAKNSSYYHFLESLDVKKELIRENRPIMLCHGTPDEKWEYFLYPFWQGEPYIEQKSRILKWFRKWHLVILGHTHQAFIFKSRGKVIVNPGSVGQPRDGDARASYAIVELTEKKIDAKIIRLEYDIEKTCQALMEENLDSYLCSRLTSGV